MGVGRDRTSGAPGRNSGVLLKEAGVFGWSASAARSDLLCHPGTDFKKKQGRETQEGVCWQGCPVGRAAGGSESLGAGFSVRPRQSQPLPYFPESAALGESHDSGHLSPWNSRL